MSMDYAIKIKLDAVYDKKDIYKVLLRGSLKGFIYHDHVFGEAYANTPIIDAASAAHKIISAFEQNVEGGPAVFTIFENGSSASMWFFKNEEGWVELQLGSFDNPRKKKYVIDFAYYIRMCLDLCDDFPIMEIRTIMF